MHNFKSGLRKMGKMGMNLPRQSQIPKHCLKQTDRQIDIAIQTDSQKIDRKTHRQTDIQVVRQI